MHPLLTVLLYAGLAWAVFYILWRIFERKYLDASAFEDRYHLSISPFHIRWMTERFNGMFLILGRSFGIFWDVWFGLGVLFGFCACVGSVCLLVYNLIHMATKKPSEQMLLTPVIPGVNVPVHQLASYFFALLLSGIFHEIGHAIAAVRERKTVAHFGVFLMFIYPGAFVEIREDFLSNTTPPYKQLKIVCAGVWHNFTLALLAVALVGLVPILVFPLYSRTEGVLIASLPEGSPFIGSVKYGDEIVSVNSRKVASMHDWEEALLAIHEQQTPIGWCATPETIREAVSRPVDCCIEPTNLQCFHVVASDVAHNVCLSARALASQPNANFCTSNRDCNEALSCATPVLESGEHIVKMQLANGTFLLFRGMLIQLWHAMPITDLKPRFSLLPISLPRHIETSLRYLFTISLALAILNLAPAYYLDGEWATRAFVAIFLGNLSETKRQEVLQWIFRFVTALLALNVVLSLTSL